MVEISALAKTVVEYINQTQKSIFLTGKAGTGKTTLLNYIVSTTHKNTVVVAPTGIAALNARGVTIHSMFQLPFAGFIPENIDPEFVSDRVRFETRNTLARHFQMNNTKRNIINALELLIIDEVSMLRPDVLDAMDYMLQRVRRNRLSFGGVQVLFIGDLMQLPPVIKNEEWAVLQKYYGGHFFFHAWAIQQNPILYIELDKIYRQKEQDFIDILNNLRNNKLTEDNRQKLNEYIKPDFVSKPDEGFITLTTHNQKAVEINKKALDNLSGKEFKVWAITEGDFPEKNYPLEEELVLKIGAQVMFIKNDLNAEKRFYNGKMGIVDSIVDDEIWVNFPEDKKTILVERYEWQNIRYTINENTKEIEEETLGTFSLQPIKLAWAITVHKSQGLTFEKAILDVSQVFVPGQLYVALSRLRSLDGLVLTQGIQINGLQSSQDVLAYESNKADKETLENTFETEKLEYVKNYIINGFLWNDFVKSVQQIAAESESSKNKEWLKVLLTNFLKINDISSKFVGQLRRIFQAESVDLVFINERLHLAIEYLMPKLRQLHFELLTQMQILKKAKKTKGILSDLVDLDDELTSLVLNIFKIEKYLACITENVEINKENLISENLKNYKKQLLFDVIGDLKESDADAKISTLEETHLLWKKHENVKKIAQIRNLKESTIYGHIAQLIEDEAIKIESIFSKAKLNKMEKAFQKIDLELHTLGEIRMKTGFEYHEIKMYLAYLETTPDLINL